MMHASAGDSQELLLRCDIDDGSGGLPSVDRGGGEGRGRPPVIQTMFQSCEINFSSYFLATFSHL
jgi:hypothetical protein